MDNNTIYKSAKENFLELRYLGLTAQQDWTNTKNIAEEIAFKYP